MQKQLSQEDYLVGLGLEATLSAALIAAQQADATYQAFIAALRVRLDAPVEQYTLEDWSEGFVRIDEVTDGRPDNPR